MIPSFTEAPLEWMLAVSGFLFSCGFFTMVTRRNAVSILMGIELVLNAANLNLVAFAQCAQGGIAGSGVQGVTFSVFVILIAAAEAAVALAIILGIYRNFGKIDVDETTMLRN